MPGPLLRAARRAGGSAARPGPQRVCLSPRGACARTRPQGTPRFPVHSCGRGRLLGVLEDAPRTPGAMRRGPAALRRRRGAAGRRGRLRGEALRRPRRGRGGPDPRPPQAEACGGTQRWAGGATRAARALRPVLACRSPRQGPRGPALLRALPLWRAAVPHLAGAGTRHGRVPARRAARGRRHGRLHRTPPAHHRLDRLPSGAGADGQGCSAGVTRHGHLRGGPRR
mmetsp:Transcript_67634/g.214011  ORF Transcript_67634/g.214011 Transcript_67634/m.214011 type:complete len:226 (+) Transcript_67634:313-990(+)